jgi:hypothetical protein
MNQDCLPVSLPQSPDGCLTSMRGTVVHDPENTAGRSVWLTPHHLIDQSAERVNSGFVLVPTQDSTAANVPGSQVLEGATSFILMLHTPGAARTRRPCRATSDAGLDAHLLVRADDDVVLSSGLPSQKSAYRSSTRPASSESFGWRGKIQYRYRQGLIASVSRNRQTLLGLIERPRAVEVLSAKSEADSRLSGNLVWHTASQAIASKIAQSLKGKSELASAARLISKGEVPACPTVTPAFDGIKVQFHQSLVATFDKFGDS